MNVVKANVGMNYMPPGHFGGEFTAKQDDKAPGNKHLAVNLSVFKPGGGCEFAEFPPDLPINLCYYVLKGQISVTTRDDKFTLYAGDSVLWAGGDARGFINDGDCDTEMLVIVGK